MRRIAGTPGALSSTGYAAVEAHRRRPARVHRRLVPGLVRVHLFQARPAGILNVYVRRIGYTGSAPPARATILVGTVRRRPTDPGTAPAIVDPPQVVPNGPDRPVRFPLASTPVRVESRVPPTFHPSAVGYARLGVQVSFTFVPATRLSRRGGGRGGEGRGGGGGGEEGGRGEGGGRGREGGGGE